MSFWIGAVVAFSIGTAIECYMLLGLAQRLLTYAEQLLVVGKALLAQVPGKSAARTESEVDEVVVAPWFPRLRLLADLRDLLRDLATRAGVTPQTTVKEALTAEPAPSPVEDTEPEHTADQDERPTDTFDAVPATAPVERADLVGGLRLPLEEQDTAEQPLPPAVDDVDLQLARFGLRTIEGHSL